MSTASTRPHLRIGGASGFWGDSSLGAPQLVNSGLIDVLVFDYLAETTMAILAAAQRKNPEAGFATDFVDPVMRQVLPEVVKRGIKVITNAGGIHPQACARALAKVADELGLQVRIAVVEGDDVRAALAHAGIDAQVVTQLAPAWTTDWMTEKGKQQLQAYGIAPPVGKSIDAAYLEDLVVPCPQCQSTHTVLVSQFGSTACKALFKCEECKEPFDYFKCH